VQETASPWRLREPADEADFGAVLERKKPGHTINYPDFLECFIIPLVTLKVKAKV
jgi:hypothetical protein